MDINLMFFLLILQIYNTIADEFILCEGNTAVLNCSYGMLNITYVQYGRTDSTTCPFTRASSMKKTSCYSSTVEGIVLPQCQSKMSCTLSASNDIFGDPCGGTYKYLNITYTCQQSTTITITTTTTLPSTTTITTTSTTATPTPTTTPPPPTTTTSTTIKTTTATITTPTLSTTTKLIETTANILITKNDRTETTESEITNLNEVTNNISATNNTGMGPAENEITTSSATNEIMVNSAGVEIAGSGITDPCSCTCVDLDLNLSDPKILLNVTNALKKEMLLDKKKLSSYKATLYSPMDDRISSKIITVTICAPLILLFLSAIIPDTQRILKCIYEKQRSWRQESPHNKYRQSLMTN